MEKTILESVSRYVDNYDIGKIIETYIDMIGPYKKDWVSIYPNFTSKDHDTHTSMFERWVLEKHFSIAFLYFHIPFCIRKCSYCIFHTISDLSLINEYLKAIHKEAYAFLTRLSSNTKVQHLYFGGGTPSLLPGNSIKTLLETTFKFIHRDNIQKITIELHPEFINSSIYNLAGSYFNRVSIGIQSFSRFVLNENKRIYVDLQKIETICIGLRKKHIQDINLDFMVGLDGQNIDSVLQDISEINKLVNKGLIDSVTVYPRIYLSSYAMANKTIYKDYLLKRFKMLLAYKEYFAKYVNWIESPMYFFASKKKLCFQPSSTINGTSTVAKLGFGSSAYSYFDNTNFRNTIQVKKYCNNITKYGTSTEHSHYLNSQEINRRYLIFGAKRGYFDYALPFTISREATERLNNLVNNFIDKGLVITNNKKFELTLLGNLFVGWIIEQLDTLFS